MQLRWMIRRDMPEVLEIENGSFEFPWTEEDFLCCLRRRNCIGMVAECNDRIYGFMLYELLKGQLHILNFAVHPRYRRIGVGRAMADKLKYKLSQQRRQELLVEVRESNLPGLMFWRSQEFLAYGIEREKWIEDTDDDAVLMAFNVTGRERGWATEPALVFSKPDSDDEDCQAA